MTGSTNRYHDLLRRVQLSSFSVSALMHVFSVLGSYFPYHYAFVIKDDQPRVKVIPMLKGYQQKTEQLLLAKVER